MKKSFLKKLAFVMAFATVATTTAPAAGVFAASKPSLTAKSKTLLLGNEDRDDYNFDIKNKVKGSKYEWTSSDEDVVTVKSNGVVTAEAIGEAEVTCVITDGKGKKIATLTAPITVKQNIKTLTINNAPTKAISVNETYDLNRSYTVVVGKKATDITRWEIVEGADKASINDKGEFTATAAGEYKVVAKSFQSKTKYAEYLKGAVENVTAVSEAVTIKVAPSIAKIEQTNTTTMVLYFDADMSSVVTKDNLFVEVNDASQQKQIVSSIKFEENGTKLTVVSYLEFKDGVEYKFYVKDNANLTAVKKASKGEAAYVKITGPATVQFQKETDVKYAVYDANGVEVGLGGKDIAFELVSGSENGYVTSGGKVYIFEKGKSVSVRVKYNSGKLDSSYSPIYLTDELTITAVDNVVALASNLYTVAKSEPDWKKLTTNTQLGAQDQNYKLFVQVTLSDKATASSASASEAGYFKFESMDQTKLLVADDGSLVPFGTGTVYVKVTYKEYAPILIPVNVGVERKAATWTFDSKVLTVSNTTQFVNVVTASATVKDNYGQQIKNADLSAAISVEDKTTGAPAVSAVVAGDKVTFKLADPQSANAGTYNYLVKYDKLSEYITIIVKDGKTNPATSWKLDAGASVKDTVRSNSKNGAEVVDVVLYGYDKFGTVVEQLQVPTVAVTAYNGGGSVSTGGAVVAGNVDAAGDFNLVGVSGGVVYKAKPGTYKLVATYNSKTYDAVFTVKDTQAVPTVALTNYEVDPADVIAVVKAAFNVNGNKDNDSWIVGAEVVDTRFNTVTGAVSSGTYLVKKVTVAQTFGGNQVLSEITVNTSVKVK